MDTDTGRELSLTWAEWTYLEHVALLAMSQHFAIQQLDELTALLAFVERLQPRTVLEIGCDAGGTLYAWSAIAPKSRRLGISLPDGVYRSGRSLMSTHGATVIAADSHDLQTVALVASWLELDESTAVDLLFVDGDHSYDGCAQDVETYGPFVRAGGMLVLHDINPNQPAENVDVAGVWRDLDADDWHKAAEIRSHNDQPGFGIGIAYRR